MVSRLARFVGMTFTDRTVQPAIGKAWSRVAETVASLGDRSFADAARFLLWSLYERADFSDAAFVADSVWRLARSSSLAWSLDPYLSVITIAGIRCVAKSYGTDPQASRHLLQQILDDPHFTEHAHSEAPWLAEGVPNIIPYDADFVATIYSTLFGRSAPQDGKSWLGGQPSQIMPLSTNRKQEYEHAYWHLNRALRAFLERCAKGRRRCRDRRRQRHGARQESGARPRSQFLKSMSMEASSASSTRCFRSKTGGRAVAGRDRLRTTS